MADSGGQSSEGLLFLTDEQLRKGIEAMFFAYRGFTADPDRILSDHAYGRAHHRALHFINRFPGTTVNNLLDILGVTKQSLNRVLRTLVEDGLVESRVGARDRRRATDNRRSRFRWIDDVGLAEGEAVVVARLGAARRRWESGLPRTPKAPVAERPGPFDPIRVCRANPKKTSTSSSTLQNCRRNRHRRADRARAPDGGSLGGVRKVSHLRLRR